MVAVVVGGGVAGPAVAMALQQVGVEAVVLERRDAREAETGSWFTIAPNGLDALDAIGCLDLAKAVGVPSRRNVMLSARGGQLGAVSLGRALPDGTSALTMKRSRLAEALLAEAARRGIEVRRGCRVVGVEGWSGRDAVVRAHLEAGASVPGELLVGADGVHSLVRRTIDSRAPEARYVGLTNFGGITRGTGLAEAAEPEAWHFVFGRKAFFGYHRLPDGDVVWFVNAPRPEIGREERAVTSKADWQSWLVEQLRHDAGPGAALVAAGELELAGDNTYDLPHVPTWHREGLVLVGDAAHAPSPSSGQGAAMALEDAVALARCLRDRSSVAGAFAAYEGLRRARVERIVAVGARSSSAKTPGPVGRLVRDAMLRIVFRFVVTDSATDWMTGHRVDWSAPVASTA